jgi:hypothetical protein
MISLVFQVGEEGFLMEHWTNDRNIKKRINIPTPQKRALIRTSVPLLEVSNFLPIKTPFGSGRLQPSIFFWKPKGFRYIKNFSTFSVGQTFAYAFIRTCLTIKNRQECLFYRLWQKEEMQFLCLS